MILARTKLLLCACALSLTACEQEMFSFGSAAPAFRQRVKLPDSTVTIDGKSYVIRRASLTDQGVPIREFWAIVDGGETFSCNSATIESCKTALKERDKDEEGGMGGGY